MRFPFQRTGTAIASHADMARSKLKQFDVETRLREQLRDPSEKIRARPTTVIDSYRQGRRGHGRPAQQPKCKTCGAVYFSGIWVPEQRQRREMGQSRSQIVCPACHQQKDGYAEGVVELHGDAWKENEENVWNTILKTEEVARSKNDQQRLIGTRDFRGITKVYVTLPQLARHIGRELGRAFKGGKIEYHTSRQDPYLRVIWKSDPPEREQLNHKSRQRRRRGVR